MTLDTAASVAEILGALLVIGGFVFAVMQLQQYKLQRRAQATIEVARSFQTPEFSKALRLLLSLPEGVSAEELKKRGPEFESAAMLVSFTIETVGLMVHRRMVSMELVWELMGGVMIDAWKRLEPWTKSARKASGSGKFNEWTQWLAEQLVRHAHTFRDQPAYVSHAKWQRKGASRL